jgi:hypothetical protein
MSAISFEREDERRNQIKNRAPKVKKREKKIENQR